MNIENLIFALRGGKVRRYHTHSMLEYQQVGSHSFNVAMICWWLASGVCRPQLLMAALTHDLAEQKYGDIPADAKRELPSYGSSPFRDVFGALEDNIRAANHLEYEGGLAPDEKHWLAMADAADGIFHCIQERRMGNTIITPVAERYITYIRELLWEACPREEDLINHLMHEWSAANGQSRHDLTNVR